MLKIKDIPLGSTDAKNEVLSNSPDEFDRFISAFVVPPALTIEKYMSRDKYYVVGLKGTGKTALLRYISIKLAEDEKSVSSFVLFKSDEDEDLRKDFARAVRVQLVTENAEAFDGDDFEQFGVGYLPEDCSSHSRKTCAAISRKWALGFIFGNCKF